MSCRGLQGPLPASPCPNERRLLQNETSISPASSQLRLSIVVPESTGGPAGSRPRRHHHLRARLVLLGLRAHCKVSEWLEKNSQQVLSARAAVQVVYVCRKMSVKNARSDDPRYPASPGSLDQGLPTYRVGLGKTLCPAQPKHAHSHASRLRAQTTTWTTRPRPLLAHSRGGQRIRSFLAVWDSRPDSWPPQFKDVCCLWGGDGVLCGAAGGGQPESETSFPHRVKF
ncbi:hypothetical protein B0I37DRAFT_138617 [Chaetomium sp. MPI-CAGE-AT-0009]|nr:hypothetical protein B0I37DRAFT_138617 [Chaetomium sp. MPI-CAGE-AT-0009]